MSGFVVDVVICTFIEGDKIGLLCVFHLPLTISILHIMGIGWGRLANKMMQKSWWEYAPFSWDPYFLQKSICTFVSTNWNCRNVTFFQFFGWFSTMLLIESVLGAHLGANTRECIDSRSSHLEMVAPACSTSMENDLAIRLMTHKCYM